MKLRTKFAITGAAAIIGGFSVATATGYPAIFSATDTAQTTQAQPNDISSGTINTATPVDTTAPTSGTSGATTDPTTTTGAVSQPAAKPAPTPAPKPATIYSDHPSAATPCRLYTENTYTNDCGTTTQQPATQTTTADPTPAPTDNTTPVSNGNTTVSNPNQP